jgi:hypothetical protein
VGTVIVPFPNAKLYSRCLYLGPVSQTYRYVTILEQGLTGNRESISHEHVSFLKATDEGLF